MILQRKGFFATLFLTGFLTVWGAVPRANADEGFSEAVKISEGDENYYLSRISNGHLAADSSGTLHVCYGSGSESDTTPDAPAYVLYRNWTVTDGWSHEVSIDDSNVLEAGADEGRHVGGRHPSMALDGSGNLWVVWQDHRHCTANENYVDNVEIYGDFRPAGGDFSSSDVRLSNSQASHKGDNGYIPRVAVDAMGKVSVCWVDFNANGNIADIYMKTSDAHGLFDPNETMAEMRLTDFAGDGGAEYAVTVVDMAVTSKGTRHLVWGHGVFSDMDLYYVQTAPGAGSITGESIKAGGTDYQDPPHIAPGRGDDLWIAYADESRGVLQERVVLLHREAGKGSFDAPIEMASSSGRQTMPDLEVDEAGRVHVAWVDERSGAAEVYYAVFDPEKGRWENERTLSTEAGSWARPCLTVDGGGDVYVLFEKKDSAFEPKGEIWFTTTARDGRAGVGEWMVYLEI